MPAAGIPPEVERALKAAGWTTITGSWKKIAHNVYEVTDGKLESKKTNGGVQVTFRGGEGTLRVMVRNSATSNAAGIVFRDAEGVNGYGYVINGGRCKIYTPSGGMTSNDNYFPNLDHSIELPGPRTALLVTAADTTKATRLEMLVNGKRESLTNYRINRDGTFLIDIAGTMTIESPKAGGS
jgi:hypothetical protein